MSLAVRNTDKVTVLNSNVKENNSPKKTKFKFLLGESGTFFEPAEQAMDYAKANIVFNVLNEIKENGSEAEHSILECDGLQSKTGDKGKSLKVMWTNPDNNKEIRFVGFITNNDFSVALCQDDWDNIASYINDKNSIQLSTDMATVAKRYDY